MINVNITHIILSPVPSANTVCTLDYRCIGSTGAYILVANNIVVQPNGQLVTPLNFTFNEDICTQGIQVRAQANCGGGIYLENVPFSEVTTTTTTVAPVTTTTTTIAPVTSTTTLSPTTTTTTTVATTTTSSTSAPVTTTTTQAPTTSTTSTTAAPTSTTSTTIAPVTTTTLAPTTTTSTTKAVTTTTTSTTAAPVTTTTTTTAATTTTSTTVTTTLAPTTTSSTTVATTLPPTTSTTSTTTVAEETPTTTTTTTMDCPDVTGADIANPAAGCNQYTITNYEESVLSQDYSYIRCDGKVVTGSIGSPNTQNGHAPQSIVVCSQNVPVVDTNYDIRVRLEGTC